MIEKSIKKLLLFILYILLFIFVISFPILVPYVLKHKIFAAVGANLIFISLWFFLLNKLKYSKMKEMLFNICLILSSIIFLISAFCYLLFFNNDVEYYKSGYGLYSFYSFLLYLFTAILIILIYFKYFLKKRHTDSEKGGKHFL